MKSQDILLLLKLYSLLQQEEKLAKEWPDEWQDWSIEDDFKQPIAILEHGRKLDIHKYNESRYTARGLETETGVSKSQVSLSLNRCIDTGLMRLDRKSQLPRVNTKALYEFIVYGIRYVFPAKPAGITRGIATAFAAPALNTKLMSAGELVPVWPYPLGKTQGQAITPLHPSVPHAVQQDPLLYSLLALVDAIRIGQPREANLAAETLQKQLKVR
ncbi:hypothetical protein C4K68_20400 [Pokkaliibacter plantistimulans]|uniref:Uncharacterized protein n=1 Tax=Proteobacteria bacterium 228 TaxID=2083153 RepID=A0A2S5KMC9_9PROT|nr:hypothetical protein [Pokkaliibacter plantistimulans]PPC75476.1 hypothetical protein C4K68_20400 [Pokkaliibacter plantistimulans]